ncbi:hypothetical protein AMECASPLE_033208 [Ameca splendens]|uniref:Uncharacterized protein n=1 Tax=Ameca splendens TaxID=208324 RepID=A0ABV0YU89_9TELE
MLAALAFTLHTIVVEENKNNIMNEQMNELFFLLPVEEDAFLCHSPISALLQLCVLSSFLEPLFAYLPKFRVMDLVNWSLNAIDQIFSTRNRVKGNPLVQTGHFSLDTRWTPGRSGGLCVCRYCQSKMCTQLDV